MIQGRLQLTHVFYMSRILVARQQHVEDSFVLCRVGMKGHIRQVCAKMSHLSLLLDFQDIL
jgi:hypothetical protein